MRRRRLYVGEPNIVTTIASYGSCRPQASHDQCRICIDNQGTIFTLSVDTHTKIDIPSHYSRYTSTFFIHDWRYIRSSYNDVHRLKQLIHPPKISYFTLRPATSTAMIPPTPSRGCIPGLEVQILVLRIHDSRKGRRGSEAWCADSTRRR